MIGLVILFLALPTAAYLLPVWPARARPALILWGAVGLCVGAAFLYAHLYPYHRSGPQDWGGAAERALRETVLIGWLTALPVQGLRWLIHRASGPGVLHVLAVLAGFIPMAIYLANS